MRELRKRFQTMSQRLQMIPNRFIFQEFLEGGLVVLHMIDKKHPGQSWEILKDLRARPVEIDEEPEPHTFFFLERIPPEPGLNVLRLEIFHQFFVRKLGNV